MSGYKRFVSYIYAYPNGKKDRNTGFAKVEARGGSCRIQLRLQKIPQEEKALDIYAFVRKGQVLQGIFLGRMPGQRGAAEGMISTREERIGDSPWPLSDLAGLWVRGESGLDYITVWDDLPVEVGRFVAGQTVETEEREMTEKGAESPEGPEPGNPEAAENKGKEGAEVPGGQVVAENAEIEPLENPEAGSPEAAENKGKEGAEVPEGQVVAENAEIEPLENPEAGSQEAAENKEKVGTEVPEGPKTADVECTGKAESDTTENCMKETEAAAEEREETLQTSLAAGQPSAQKGVTEQQSEAEIRMSRETTQSMRAQEAVCPLPASLCPRIRYCPAGLEHRWNCLSKNYAHRNPFCSEDIQDCIQICPRDIHVLRQQNWNLSRNSFLIHGYYQFHHLLLIRRSDGTCLLGIPGFYDIQEEKMAVMFGFPVFLDAPGEKRDGRFGYWCRQVE
ncbi:MAG: DUF6128 domain-containing protein [Candidatus Limivivens sp.]|nr:DUF6128 domain-containing protein [Candidatus Limivivens sp.]